MFLFCLVDVCELCDHIIATHEYTFQIDDGYQVTFVVLKRTIVGIIDQCYSFCKTCSLYIRNMK